MDKTPTSTCPSCATEVHLDWLACPHCRAILHTSAVRNRKSRLISILVGVIVVLLVILGGLGAWWYYMRPATMVATPLSTDEPSVSGVATGATPVPTDELITVTVMAVKTPVPSVVVPSATPQATAALVQETAIADPALVSLSLSSDTIVEDGDSVMVTAHLSGVALLDLHIKLELSGSATGQRIDYTPGTDTFTDPADLHLALKSSGSATGKRVDYTLSADTIRIPSGGRSGYVLLTGEPDSDIEQDETVVIAIGDVANPWRSDGSQVMITIVQTEPIPSLVLVTSPVTIAESGGQAEVTIVASEPTSEELGVTLSFTGSAEFGRDYDTDTQFVLILTGSRTGTLATITGLPDNIAEGEEAIVVGIEKINSESYGVYRICGKVSAGQWRDACISTDFRTIIIREDRTPLQEKWWPSRIN